MEADAKIIIKVYESNEADLIRRILNKRGFKTEDPAGLKTPPNHLFFIGGYWSMKTQNMRYAVGNNPDITGELFFDTKEVTMGDLISAIDKYADSFRFGVFDFDSQYHEVKFLHSESMVSVGNTKIPYEAFTSLNRVFSEMNQDLRESIRYIRLYNYSFNQYDIKKICNLI